MALRSDLFKSCRHRTCVGQGLCDIKFYVRPCVGSTFYVHLVGMRLFPLDVMENRRGLKSLVLTWSLLWDRGTSSHDTFLNQISDEAGKPPEFKHIIKGRKRN